MIHLPNKNFLDPPPSLQTVETYEKIDQACINSNGDLYKSTDYRSEDVLNKLRAFSLHKNVLGLRDKPKCYYCESSSEEVASLQVEHYRPKAKVVSQDTNGQFHKGYYWLGLEWSNLLLSCPKCNGRGAKGNRFPLHNHRNRATNHNPITRNPLLYNRHSCISSNPPLSTERPLLLNPEIDRPERHLTFNTFGEMSGLSIEGNTSIDIYKLNRDPLKVNREDMINDILDSIYIAIAANKLRRSIGDSFLAWLEGIFTKVVTINDPTKKYSLWGQFIIDNFENCIIVRLPQDYHDIVRTAFSNIQN